MEMWNVVLLFLLAGHADNVLSRGCHFTDNHVLGSTSTGGAIYAENTVAMNIEESFFDNNYADSPYSGVVSRRQTSGQLCTDDLSPLQKYCSPIRLHLAAYVPKYYVMLWAVLPVSGQLTFHCI